MSSKNKGHGPLLATAALIIVIAACWAFAHAGGRSPGTEAEHPLSYGYLPANVTLTVNTQSTAGLLKGRLSADEMKTLSGAVHDAVSSLFAKTQDPADFAASHFTVQSLRLEPVSTGASSPPERSALTGVRLVVSYTFSFDWLQAKYGELSPGAGPNGGILLAFNLADAANGTLTADKEFTPADAPRATALSKGPAGIITHEQAQKKLERSVTDPHASETQYVSFAGGSTHPMLEETQSGCGNLKRCSVDLNDQSVSCRAVTLTCGRLK